MELKPCPFCGGEPRLVEEISLAKIACMNRGCEVEPETPWFWSVDEAAEAWNTRAERTCKAANVAEYAWDDFECSECGWVTWSFLMEHEGCGTVCKPRYCPNCGAKVVDE